MPIMSHEDSIKVIDGVNNVIKNSGIDTNKISDGYHTFGELYDHRIALFMALCSSIPYGKYTDNLEVWKSKLHHDGTTYDGWFIMGIGKNNGEQISYHLPMSKWDECNDPCIRELAKAPEWDGHTSSDVLERLKSL